MDMKALLWMGSSKKDLKSFPEGIQDVFGFALYQAQTGEKHEDAKPLKGFGSAGVLEVVENDQGGTYRAVYTVRFSKPSTSCIVSRRSRLAALRLPNKIST